MFAAHTWGQLVNPGLRESPGVLPKHYLLPRVPCNWYRLPIANLKYFCNIY
jgi:hypothetical protein